MTEKNNQDISLVTPAGSPLAQQPTKAESDQVSPTIDMQGEQQSPQKIKLVFYGDAPCVATGFGKVSSNILKPLWDTGKYEIYCFGVNYLGIPHPYPFQIYPMLPNQQGDPYGREKIQQILPQLDFDIMFFLQDSFIMTFLPNLIQNMKRQGKNFRSLVYFPIDGEPEQEWIEAMASCDVCTTYTEFGRKQCINKLPEIESKLQVIPHGINLQEFFPHPPEKIAQLRRFYFGPHADKFIVINVNRNQQRKDIPRSMLAFREFKKECPNSILYLHCAQKDVGWDLTKVARNIGLSVGDDVIFPNNFNVNSGFPVSVVNDLYNCSDVCISACVGEGWGLSSVEAMATKTPAIFPDNTSLSEIFADGRGFLCRSGDTSNFWTCMTMDNDVMRPLMNISDMVKYLKRLYEKPEIGKKMAEKAHRWVVDELQWGKSVVPRFDSILTSLYADLKRPSQDSVFNQVSTEDERSNWKKGSLV